MKLHRLSFTIVSELGAAALHVENHKKQSNCEGTLAAESLLRAAA